MKHLIILSGVALLALALSACSDDEASTGTVRVTLQDAPANVEKLLVPVSEVAIHFVPQGQTETAPDDAAADAGDDPETAGWRTILAEEKTFDLLTLKDNPTDLGDLELVAGKITQIRLYISETAKTKVTVAGVEHEVEVPSGKVKIVGNVDVVPGDETVLALDFDALDSLKEQAGGYKLIPTIKLLR